jgi:protein phosphatase
MAVFNLFRRKPRAARIEPAFVGTQADSAPPLGPPRPRFAVRSFGLSDCGQSRPSNEDRFVVVELARTMYIHQTNLPQLTPRCSGHRGHAFLVADGVGGNVGGEVASSVTVAAIEEYLLNTLKRFSNLQIGEAPKALEELKNALLHAEARLFGETAKHPEWHGMGTTLTLAFAVNWMLFIAHVGDSRCYLLTNEGLHQMTQDHTLAAELVREGVLSPEREAQHPYRNVVTNILGGRKPGVQVDLHRLDLYPADVILLCTDGLTDMVPNEIISTILREEHDPRSACEQLVAEANRRGGNDNITVIVAHIEEPPGHSQTPNCNAPVTDEQPQR